MPGSGTENKSTGSFYTPAWCADVMLDMSDFEERLANRSRRHNFHIADPACGDGALLSRACARAIGVLQGEGMENGEIARFLEENLHGMELDEKETCKARRNIAEASNAAGISIDASVLDIIAGDAFENAPRLYGKMDYVIGNPPYVRIHNLAEKPDSPYVEGMCDLYLAFYDLGQQLLADGGRLVYIAPSSWMTSRAGEAMRRDLESSGRLSKILDFKHFQVFDNATAYVAIAVLDKEGRHDKIELCRFAEETFSLDANGAHKAEADGCWIDGCFYADADERLRSILLFDESELDKQARRHAEQIRVRNGYATMRDKTFISNEPRFPGSGLEIEVVKASKAKTMYALYPHGKSGKIIPLDDIEATCPAAYELLVEDKQALLARNKIDIESWWGYGRTQGIVDTYRDKVTIQSIVHPDKPVLTRDAPSGTGVFGGLYVLGMPKDMLDRAVADEMFWQYVRALSKYKSGGYYTFGGRELEKYLRWWSAQHMVLAR